MKHTPFFWLHIKKSGGTSIRQYLHPYYIEVDRSKRPPNFIQSSPVEYNDILNNYRIPLGEYQFKRCLFAKKYLYPNTWDTTFSFAFSREPISRCVSMFHYLYFERTKILKNIALATKGFFHTGKICSINAYSFDVFLETVQQARQSRSIYTPINNHFTTHTAPMWDDITDHSGAVLLTRIFRLESLTTGINSVFKECHISKKIQKNIFSNTNKQKRYIPTIGQIRKIKNMYENDFCIYENAIH